MQQVKPVGHVDVGTGFLSYKKNNYLRIGKVMFTYQKQDPKDLWIGILAFNKNCEIHPWMYKVMFFGHRLCIFKPWYLMEPKAEETLSESKDTHGRKNGKQENES